MTTIQQIFDKDPLSYTKEDISEVVKYFRQKRLEFKLGDKSAGSPKKISAKGSQDLTKLELDF